MNKKRVQWIDIAKFWGMLFIYLGHFGVGYSYLWVFSFHVPLFFFLSGCLEKQNNNNIKLVEEIYHRFVNIVVPFFFFGILTGGAYAIYARKIELLWLQIVCLLKGNIRNNGFLTGQLWFLSCLFVVEVMFCFIRRVKSRGFVMIICLFIFGFYFVGIDSYLVWWWNVDSACYYLIYYCIGWVVFPYIKLFFESKNKMFSLVRRFFYILCILYSSSVFFENDWLSKFDSVNIMTHMIYTIVSPMMSIFVVIYSSHLMRNVNVFNVIGKNSLYMCGNEILLKDFLRIVILHFGLDISLILNPAELWVYSLILLIIVQFIIIPIEKPILEKIKGVFVYL